MKLSSKFLVALTLLLAFNFTANAQQRDGRGHDPAKMAEQQTTQMVEKLSLDEGQAAKVRTINLTYAKKMHEVLEENKGNRDAMKEIGAAINAEKSAEMKLVLTKAQFQSYEEMEAKEEKRRGERGGKGGGRRTGK